MENPILYVERIMWLLREGGVDEGSVRRAGEMLGTPVKRVDALRARYSDVFSRFIEKRCSEAGSQYVVCIYSWNRRKSFRIFPASLYATGTIILFRGEEPVEVLSNPIPKAIDYQGALELVPQDIVPIYASKRVDGWQVNAYYDKILGRWIFSTRYVLHNMYFSRGVLNIDKYGEISNPIVSLADSIASRENLYGKLAGREGWTFVFNIVGPEPAITAPPYPIAPNPEEYRLYLVAARRSDGVLISGSEASKEIGWGYYPEPVLPASLNALYSYIRSSLNTRSIIAWVKSGAFEQDPMLVEIPSQYYYDAMMVKHLYDAKSALILCSEGLADHLKNLVPENIGARVEAIDRIYRALVRAFEVRGADDMLIRSIIDLVRSSGARGIASEDEIKSEISSGNVRRAAKKILATIFEERSLASDEISSIISRIDEIIGSMGNH